MASVALYDHQVIDPSMIPAAAPTYLKRKIADMLESAGLIDWIVKGVSARRKSGVLVPREYSAIRVMCMAILHPPKPPDPKPLDGPLPPVEVGGCRFVGPIRKADPENTIVKVQHINISIERQMLAGCDLIA